MSSKNMWTVEVRTLVAVKAPTAEKAQAFVEENFEGGLNQDYGDKAWVEMTTYPVFEFDSDFEVLSA